VLTAIFWKKAWVWFKNYWYFPVILILGILLLFSGKGSKNKMFKLLEEQKERYNKEIEIINESNAEKDKKQKEAIKASQDKLKEIERQFDVKIEQLEGLKEQELQEMVKEYEDNPEELARRIAEILDAQLVER